MDIIQTLHLKEKEEEYSCSFSTIFMHKLEGKDKKEEEEDII